jgi:hypothetical protein
MSWEDVYERAKAKLLDGEKLEEEEIAMLYEASKTVNEWAGENRRWTRTVTTTIQIEGIEDRYWNIEWEEALTEIQESYFVDQPYEVKPVKEIVPAHEVIRYVKI